MCDEDWAQLDAWSRVREGLWGPYQRFQLDHLPALRQAYAKGGLLAREAGFLLVETKEDHRPVGFVRYTLARFPDADFPYPEIGFGIADPASRGKGLGREAVELLVGYLFAGYAANRIAAFTDVENVPARRLLESLGFRMEGVLRRSSFRDGHRRDLAS